MPNLGFALERPPPGIYDVPIRYIPQRRANGCGFAALAMAATARRVTLDQIACAAATDIADPRGFVLPELSEPARHAGFAVGYSYRWEPEHFAALASHGWIAIVGVLWSRLTRIYEERGIPLALPETEDSELTSGDGHVVVLYGVTVTTNGSLRFRIADPANTAAHRVELDVPELRYVANDSFGLGWDIEALVLGPTFNQRVSAPIATA